MPIFTSRFTAVYRLKTPTEDLPFVPVRTSLGLPRFIREASKWPYAEKLAPKGMIHVADRDEFNQRYHALLDGYGFDAVAHDLVDIWRCQTPESYRETPPADRKPLALLCFEDLDTDDFCHRRCFASWWLENTGEEVDEVNTVDGLHDRFGTTPDSVLR
jgi:hypothetical protein